MMKPWHRSDPEYFEREKREVKCHFVDLRVRLINESVVLEGEFPLITEGRVMDRYSVEITLAKDHPRSLPVVREVAGRIPRLVDRHINSDGTACVMLPDERWQSWPVGAPLVDFLNGPLRNYFICQSLVEAGDSWPMEQLAHGAKGILASYAKLLGTNEQGVIRDYLVCLAAKHVRGHWSCPCGSGKRLRDCHLAKVLELRGKISTTDAVKSLSFLSRP
jgi:hypothetical protein